VAGLAGILGYDLIQRRRAILRNFPIANNEERPFLRDQRWWIAASSEGRSNVSGFGTDDEMETVESLLGIKHSPFPAPEPLERERWAPA